MAQRSPAKGVVRLNDNQRRLPSIMRDVSMPEAGSHVIDIRSSLSAYTRERVFNIFDHQALLVDGRAKRLLATVAASLCL